MTDWKKDLLKQVVVAVLEYITCGMKNNQYSLERGKKIMSDWKKDLLKQIIVVVLEYITDGIKNKQVKQQKEER